MVSPEATYDGRFRINTSTKPMHIDIDFVDRKREIGRTAYVRLDDDDVCFLMATPGHERPTDFSRADEAMTFSLWKRRSPD